VPLDPAYKAGLAGHVPVKVVFTQLSWDRGYLTFPSRSIITMIIVSKSTIPLTKFSRPGVKAEDKGRDPWRNETPSLNRLKERFL